MNTTAVAHPPLGHPLLRTPAAAATLRIFAACGDTLYRRGVAAVLDEQGGFDWAGEATDHEATLSLAGRVQPDVVIVDGDLPGPGGVATVLALRPLLPRARYVVLLGALEPEAVRAAVTAGAGCVMHKNAGPQEFIAALQALHLGVWAHPPAVTRALTAPRGAPPLLARLTPRERDLLTLMARGLTNSDIARELAIAMPTVKFHVGHIMSKLGVGNRTAAVLAALRHKLVDLEPRAASSQPAA